MLFLKVFARFMPLTCGWNSDVHLKITADGLTRALRKLERDGVLKGMGLSRVMLAAMFSWLGLYNTAEDVEWCNLNDLVDDQIKKWAKLPANAPGMTEFYASEVEKRWGSKGVAHSCAVGLGGDQITHFMQSEFEPGEQRAWDRSYKKTFENCKAAWQLFTETFPSSKGLLAHVEGLLMEARDISIFDMTFGGVIKDNVIAPDAENTVPTKGGVVASWLADRVRSKITAALPFQTQSNKFREGQHLLGRALHTLQDAFSPAHVCRDKSGMKILRIFMYDKQNRDPGPQGPPVPGATDDKYGTPLPGEYGWPGHHPFDHKGYHEVLENCATSASEHLIYGLINNLHTKSGAAAAYIDNTLRKWLQHDPW